MLTNECDIHTTLGQRSTFCDPAQTVFVYPLVKVGLRIICQTKIRGCNALEDVVIVLGRAEDAR